MGIEWMKPSFHQKFKFSHLNLVDLVVAKVEDLKLAQAGEEPSPDLNFKKIIQILNLNLDLDGCLPTFVSRL